MVMELAELNRTMAEAARDGSGSLGRLGVGRRRIELTIGFALVLSAVAITPFNKELAAGLRINDCAVIAALIVSIWAARIKKDDIIILSTFTILFCLATISGLIVGAGFKLERLGFLYKYLVIFFIPVLCFSCIDRERRLLMMTRIIFLVFIVLIGWVYYYVVSTRGGLIIGANRVSFPGSDEYTVSDAHLYSSYLAATLLGYFFFIRRQLRHGVILSYVTCVLALGALLLTGSRNGLIALFLGVAVYTGSWLLLRRKKIPIFSLVLYVLAGFVVALVIFYYQTKVTHFLGDMLLRATTFSFSQDLSALHRIFKFQTALRELQQGFLPFGVGPFSADLLWYDSFVSITLAHFGFVGVIFWMVILFHTARRMLHCAPLSTPLGRAAMSVLAAYIASNLVTEFVLVTRSALPTIVLICLPLIAARLNRDRLYKVELY